MVIKYNIMAYYAVLDENNFVIDMKSAGHEDDWDGEIGWFNELGIVHKRTSYNTHGGIHYQSDNNTPSLDQSKAFRKNYAGIGYYYDSIRDAFIPPKPYPSWTLDEFSCLWQPPIPYPNDGNQYYWDEENKQWNIYNT
jgi:hypothetical protein